MLNTPINSANAFEAKALSTKANVLGYDLEAFEALLSEHAVQRVSMRARQLSHWIYARGACDFEAMTSISKPLRLQLAEIATLERPHIKACQQSADGTIKWLLSLNDGNQVETVFIPDNDRGTLCVSSQVGCTLSCRFCHTGTQTLVRNLTCGEIISQLMLARDQLGDWQISADTRRITNIVMMGMGEPLYNTDNVIAALKLICDGDGISISKRRVTLSTAGVVPQIHRIGEECGVLLAISLHACNNALRNQLVPLNKKYPLEQLIECVRHYPGLNNAKRVTWEYVLLDGINDSPDDARALIRLIRKIPSKVNLIPFNPWPNSPYRCSPEDSIRRFADIIWKAGYSSPVRTPRGSDILAACGQLKSESQRSPKHKTPQPPQSSQPSQ